MNDDAKVTWFSLADGDATFLNEAKGPILTVVKEGKRFKICVKREKEILWTDVQKNPFWRTESGRRKMFRQLVQLVPELTEVKYAEIIRSLFEIDATDDFYVEEKGRYAPTTLKKSSTTLPPDELETLEAKAREKVEKIPPEEMAEITKPMTVEELKEILGLTIKKDDINKIIQFLGMLLAYTEDSQINISNRGPSSSGKSYIPIELATLYFPPQDVVMVAYSSPTAFFHDQGEWDDAEKAIRINLERKILIFLDQPHDQLLERLRPLLSHDQKELLIKITDKREKRGMRTKNVRLIGFPSVFFCTGSFQRIDEQEATRHILLSPETSVEKIREALYLKALKKGNPIAYQRFISSNKKRELLRKRVLLIRNAGIRRIILKDPDQVARKFLEKYPRLKPRHTRDIERIISLAQGIALLNMWHKQNDGNGDIYVDEEDIETAFAIYDQVAPCQELGVAPYLYQLYKEVVQPIFKQYSECKGGVNTIGISRQDVIKKHYEVYGRPLPDWVLRQEILPALESAGLVYQEEDPNNRRRKLIFLSTTLETPTPPSHSLYSHDEKQTKIENTEKLPIPSGLHRKLEGEPPEGSTTATPETHPPPRPRPGWVSVIPTMDMPQIMAPDPDDPAKTIKIGPFKKGERVSVPPVLAESLRRRGAVNLDISLDPEPPGPSPARPLEKPASQGPQDNEVKEACVRCGSPNVSVFLSGAWYCARCHEDGDLHA